MIDQISADVMAVQEVGSAASLKKLNRQLAHPYPYCHVLPGNSSRSIHVGYLSRYPLNVLSHADYPLRNPQGDGLQFYASQEDAQSKHLSPLKFSRDLLQAQLALEGGRRLALFCVHLKSKANFEWQIISADEIRWAECAAIQEIVGAYAQQNPEDLLCLLGDGNDVIGSAAFEPLGSLGLQDPLGERLQAAGRNPSTYWPKRRTRIDHILVNNILRNTLDEASPTIHANSMAQTASDHYAVSMSFNIQPK